MMKLHNYLSLGITLLAISGMAAVSVQSQTLKPKPLGEKSFQLVTTPQGYTFRTAHTYFRARARQSDGLYRGINIHTTSKDTMHPEATLTAYARFGRTDARKANRWILGDVVLLSYDREGTSQGQSRMKRLFLIDLK